MITLVYKGTKKGLQIIDLYKVLDADKSDKLGDILEEYWEKEFINAKLNGRTPSLLKVMFQAFGWNYMAWGIVMLLQMLNRYVP